MKLQNEIEDIIVDFEHGDLSAREAVAMTMELCAKFSEENTNQHGDYDVGGDIAQMMRKQVPSNVMGESR